jgi:hypothetical protein
VVPRGELPLAEIDLEAEVGQLDGHLLEATEWSLAAW